MEVEAAGTFERAEHRTWRAVALSAIGPLTVLAGIVWATAQPYRLTLLDAAIHGGWDHVAQPPLLVAALGVSFHVVVARPLARAVEGRA